MCGCPRAMGGRKEIDFACPARTIGGRKNIEFAFSARAVPCTLGGWECGCRREIRNQLHAAQCHAPSTRCARAAAQLTDGGMVPDARCRSPRGLGVNVSLVRGTWDVGEYVGCACGREAIGGRAKIKFACEGAPRHARDNNGWMDGPKNFSRGWNGFWRW